MNVASLKLPAAAVEGLHDAADLAATHAFQHVPADRLVSIVGTIRRELAALRLGSTDVAPLRALISDMQTIAATDDARACIAELDKAAIELGAGLLP